MSNVIIVGSGLGGLAAAVTAATNGAQVTLLERGERFGGAAAFSGGQVWVGANHVAARQGSDDDVDQTMRYIAELAAKEPSVFEAERSREWVESARAAAQWFEDQDVIEWTVIPDYPDYYHPDVEGSMPWGRYLTGAPFDGELLGTWRGDLLEGPHFPVGMTYAEVVDRSGRRFCDDSFHPAIVAAALAAGPDERAHVPMFMIWDEQHHQKYGLGATGAGGEYPAGLVTSAPTLRELGDTLGIDGAELEATASSFNEHAANCEDPEFGRGSNASVRRFRGDNTAEHPNIGPVEQAPFHGMRLRLLNTGIASGGLRTTDHGRVVGTGGEPIDGLYAVGECAVRSTGGGGYNSGYSLSRAMTFGWLAARHVLEA